MIDVDISECLRRRSANGIGGRIAGNAPSCLLARFRMRFGQDRRRLSSRQLTLVACGPAVDPTPAPSTAGPPACGSTGAWQSPAPSSQQVETADCIANMEEIAALPGIDILFLGQNDLCMSMGLFAREYVFPAMYFSKELNEATDKLVRRSSSLR